jgi:C1A family cysteine protease
MTHGFGLHAISLCGYDDSKHAYYAINSWGTSWGSAGYIWIDYDFLATINTTLYVIN